MKKNLKCISLILVATAIFSGCKKNEQPKSDSEIITKGNNLSIGDGKWDVLSYGYDVTGDFLNPNNISDAPILDMKRFETDYLQRIDVGTGSIGTDSAYIGSSAIDYLKEVSKKRSWGLEASYGQKESKDTNKTFFSASVNRNKQDDTKSTFYSRFSYASYESYRAVKRIRFTGDAPVSLLMNYLTPEFINNVATRDADYLVSRYGTHVLLDITLGGRLRFDYSATIANQSEYSRKVRNTKVGIAGFLKKVGINFSSDVSNEEINKVLTESSSKQFTVTYYGGTTSGLSLTADANGNFSQSLNIASWQQSVNDRNSQLVEIGKAVRLSDFITDPVKKSQVNAAIDKRINDSQIKELGELPVHEFHNASSGGHVFTINKNDYPYEQNGWEYFGVKFHAFTTQKSGTLPVHLFIKDSVGQHVLTINRNDYPYLQNGYTYAGVAFYAYPNQANGTLPVYIYYNAQINKHTYTAYPGEYAYEQNGWQNDGVSFYAFPR
ncbi:MAC/perforin domain-containing protein [Pedobacter steynii]|uniref:MACPF domain-containing protein n=1 Tax=Pedobacter steynii TaxID=430522 RepID=A0A1D7QJ91_9SPHI|nr:MAC/perforin domain-containing protein [Pedobacter steynii]AOM78741.1 hypothetical protein BFS30_17100 [Pedobacter steynii]